MDRDSPRRAFRRMENAAYGNHPAGDCASCALREQIDMEQLHYVTHAVPCPGLEVQVQFDTGEKGIFDCAYLTSDPYWQRLKDEKFFNTARAEYGTIVWDDNIDVAPESVWNRSRIYE